jgi:hypothetical protein
MFENTSDGSISAALRGYLSGTGGFIGNPSGL